MLDALEQESVKLPSLRQDISLSKGGSSWTGAPTWLIHDGFRNKFFRIDLSSFELLAIWRNISIEKFVSNASAKLGREVKAKEVETLIEFLYSNSLTETTTNESWEGYHQQSVAGKKSWWHTLMHKYIFFRIPLVRPQKFIDATWPAVSFLFSKPAIFIYLIVAVLGLYLVSQQWGLFLSTFMDFLTFEGLLIYGFSLVFIKIFHEMGHAYMARKYNVEVPIIGAAFIVLMPILYTDTTGATKLSDKRKRLMIDMAGIYVELILASIATLLWILLPDGPLRSVAFTTATLSWLLSLLVNLNPLMRFDGYYIVADFFEIENLQERGFALAKWQIRKTLFGLDHASPEALPRRRRNMVIFHAWATWIYRFFLFLGIALMVYAFFIKIIGILLFVVEILWFILMPIFKELKQWWAMRKEIIRMKRYMVTGSILTVLAIFMFLPISSKVSVPAILAHKDKATLYATIPSQVIAINLKEGQRVNKGDLLVELVSPEINSKIKLETLQAKLLQKRISRIGADVRERSVRLILEEEFASKVRTIEGLISQKEKLKITSPISGILSAVDGEISVGTWLNASYPIAIIKPDEAPSFFGYVSEMDVERLSLGSKGYFLTDSGEHKSIELELASRANVAASTISEPYFANIYGGKLPTVPNVDKTSVTGEIKLRGGWYPVRMQSVDHAPQELSNVITGVAILDAEPISIGAKIFRRSASILIRELGL